MNNNNFSTMDAKSIINEFLNKFNQTDGAEYHFNILEEQQGNIVENSHTNILIRLLSYKNRFGYIFLQSFCERFFEKFTGNLNVDNIIFETESPLCSTANGNGRMDGLIYSKNNSKYDFAIIIENKINCAPAGEKQLEKYINSVSEKSNIFSQQTKNNYKKIWVVYLTREGNEKPDKDSCDFLKKEFDCTIDANGEITGERYAALSYSDDILPWLKDEIIPMVPIADIILYSGLIQYADYLDRLFGYDYNKNMSNQIDAFLLDEISGENSVCQKNKMLTELYDEVNERLKNDQYKQYKDLLSALKKSINRINRSLIADFINASCDYFEGNYPNGIRLFNRCFVKHSMDFRFVFFTDESWPKSIHFEWFPLRDRLCKDTTYHLCFHIEDNRLREIFRTTNIGTLLVKLGYKKVNNHGFSYSKEVTLSKPILCMTYDKLKAELINVYQNVALHQKSLIE